MTSQESTHVALEDAPANSGAMELAKPSAIPPEQSRLYQLEMFEASMARNTIVVMDTGSGKTHIAVMRIQAELERCLPQKRVWFLAPTVALCEQQCTTLRTNIPYVQTRLLVGSDNVDRWSEQRIWDAVLENVRIVVSTHGVLSDALSHGFVRIEELALLVFDEAHHCAGEHPANKIMKNYYHPLLGLKGPNAVPHILGLTASPVIRSKPSDLEIIERNLNALCRTPRVHRGELLEYVHPPTFVRLAYLSNPSIHGQYSSPALANLVAVYTNVMNSSTSRDSDDIDLIKENSKEWGDMENQMREEYQKDASKRHKLQQLEDAEEHVEGRSNARFEIKSTGALLTLETAVAHIHHFCATLPPQPYVDLQPKFYFQESFYGMITGNVILPNCVDSSVRTAASGWEWKSERMAKKDAAFQAYVALYKKGLINDNLLPLLLGKEEDVMADIETRASVEEVSEIFNPWTSIAKSWMEPGDSLKKKLISIARPGRPTLYLAIVFPRELPTLETFTIYWDNEITYSISISDATPISSTDTSLIPIMRQVTSTIFQAVHFNRVPIGRDDFLALFIPHISEELLQSWLEESAGNWPAAEILDTNAIPNASYGLIRDQARYAAPHIFKEKGDDGTIKVIRLPKRRDFLHRSFASKPDTEHEVDCSEKPALFLPLESSTIDKLPMEYVECSLLIPSIMHRLWRKALALDLYKAVFEDQGFLNLDYVITATNAPSANENSNYQRLEFIGDSVLKYLVCVNLYVTQPSWPEGYLSRAKDLAVANSRLSLAALAVGLDRYIVTKTFTARKWSPPYIQDILDAASSPEKRTLSTKVLADVVEALIGGSFLDRGFEAAATCISRFLPEMPITAPLDIFAGGFATESGFAPSLLANGHLSDVERLIGYQFKNRGYLLEAITHPSCEHDSHTSSYQRLEFIGDATLDMIVVSFMIDNAPELSHGRMHLTKTAVVNAGFLAYLCMDATHEQVVTDVSLSPNHYSTGFTEVHSSKLVHLCQLMRHQHPEINTTMSICLERYHKLQPAIAAAITHGNEYPWVLLTSLAPAKFLSDIVESIIGAVLIDAGGDLSACKKVAENLGLIAYLRRILDEDIDILHPKNKLGEMSGGRTVEYKLGKEGQEYTCIVEVGGTAIVGVSQGISQEEVMTQAAYMAAELLG
ncbi:hypothetical protein VE02_02895 [Pseudogymnoascus sp. 03VT05]|nr:hypothetical protein VE02_02895 [Pseudogymnoascus sp. 03VT05]